MRKTRCLLVSAFFAFFMLFFSFHNSNLYSSEYWELVETQYHASGNYANYGYNWNRPPVWSDTQNWAPQGVLLGTTNVSARPGSVEVSLRGYHAPSNPDMLGKFTWSAPPQRVYPGQFVSIPVNLQVFRDFTATPGNGVPHAAISLQVSTTPLRNTIASHKPYISSPSACSYKNNPAMSEYIWFGNSFNLTACNHNSLPNGNAVYTLQETFDNKREVNIDVWINAGMINVTERYRYELREARFTDREKADMLFNWIESLAPQMLPSGFPTLTLTGIIYRHYPSSNVFLATYQGKLFFIDPHGRTLDFGDVDDWLPYVMEAP